MSNVKLTDEFVRKGTSNRYSVVALSGTVDSVLVTLKFEGTSNVFFRPTVQEFVTLPSNLLDVYYTYLDKR